MLLDLSVEEQARIDAGLCACGCGSKLPPVGRDAYGREDDRGRRVASSACRKRLHRQRIKAGRRVTLPERRRRRQVAQLEARIREARREAAAARRNVAYWEDVATRLEASLAAARNDPALFDELAPVGEDDGDDGDDGSSTTSDPPGVGRANPGGTMPPGPPSDATRRPDRASGLTATPPIG